MELKFIRIGPSKLATIKIVKDITFFSLKDCKQIVDSCPVIFTINEADPVKVSQAIVELKALGVKLEVIENNKSKEK